MGVKGRSVPKFTIPAFPTARPGGRRTMSALRSPDHFDRSHERQSLESSGPSDITSTLVASSELGSFLVTAAESDDGGTNGGAATGGGGRGAAARPGAISRGPSDTNPFFTSTSEMASFHSRDRPSAWPGPSWTSPNPPTRDDSSSSSSPAGPGTFLESGPAGHRCAGGHVRDSRPVLNAAVIPAPAAAPGGTDPQGGRAGLGQEVGGLVGQRS
jgi:hypothetical protein